MQEALFYGFNLERHVPDDHLLRKIDRFVDLSEVRAHLGPYHSDVGRPSIDPELMVRMLIVGYCLGIRSERRHAAIMNRRPGKKQSGSSAPPDPLKPTEFIVEVFNSPEPPSPLIQTENALDDLEETLTELAKHGPMPASLQRKVDLLVDKARDRITHMRIDNPALKELMLIVGVYLGRKMQTDRATEAKREQFEKLITAIRRFKPTIVKLVAETA